MSSSRYCGGGAAPVPWCEIHWRRIIFNFATQRHCIRLPDDHCRRCDRCILLRGACFVRWCGSSFRRSRVQRWRSLSGIVSLFVMAEDELRPRRRRAVHHRWPGQTISGQKWSLPDHRPVFRFHTFVGDPPGPITSERPQMSTASMPMRCSDVPPHRVGPRLGAKDADGERQIAPGRGPVSRIPPAEREAIAWRP